MADGHIDGKGEAFDYIATQASIAMSQITRNPQQAAQTMRDAADAITIFADADTDAHSEEKPTAEVAKGYRIDVA